jgi:hypothetical protein
MRREGLRAPNVTVMAVKHRMNDLAHGRARWKTKTFGFDGWLENVP